MLSSKNNKLLKQILLEISFFVLLLIIDLVSKEIIFKFLENEPMKSFVVLEGIFTFIQAKNYGASFGIFNGEQTFLIVLTSIVLIGLLIFLYVKPNSNKNLRIGLLMIISGGLGNLIDRIAFGYVRDFIDYTFLDTFFNIDFAIGNIADIFLLIGTLLTIVFVLFDLQYSFTEKNNNDSISDDNIIIKEETNE